MAIPLTITVKTLSDTWVEHVIDSAMLSIAFNNDSAEDIFLGTSDGATSYWTIAAGKKEVIEGRSFQGHSLWFKAASSGSYRFEIREVNGLGQ